MGYLVCSVVQHLCSEMACFDCSGLSPPPTCCWSTGLLVVSSRRRHFRSPGLDLWTDRSCGKAVCSPDALSLLRAQQTSCTYQLLHLNLWRTSMCKYFPMSTFISNFQNICDNLTNFHTTFIFQGFLYQLPFIVKCTPSLFLWTYLGFFAIAPNELTNLKSDEKSCQK